MNNFRWKNQMNRFNTKIELFASTILCIFVVKIVIIYKSKWIVIKVIVIKELKTPYIKNISVLLPFMEIFLRCNISK